MNDEPRSRPLTMIFLAGFLSCAFFVVFAYFFLSQGKNFFRFAAPGSSWDEAHPDKVRSTPGPLPFTRPRRKSQKRFAPVARSGSGHYIPRTEAERRYFLAMNKARRLKKRNLTSRLRREKLQSFLDSPLGQTLAATFELAHRGRPDEAKRFIEKIIGDVAEMDIDIQKHVMQAAISIYAHDKDRSGLARMLLRYLRLLKRHNQGERVRDGTGANEINEWISRLEDKMGEIERNSK